MSTECEEIAKVLQTKYNEWLSLIGLISRLHLAREFTRTNMQDESETVIDNVAEALHKGSLK